MMMRKILNIDFYGSIINLETTIIICIFTYRDLVIANLCFLINQICYLINGFIFNHIKKLTIKILSNLSYINIHYHLRLGASPLHRQFFKKLVQNRDYIQTHCNDRRNTFHFACRQWYSYNNHRILT